MRAATAVCDRSSLGCVRVCPGLTVGDGVLRLAVECELTSALWRLCVVAGVCAHASGSDRSPCVPHFHASRGLRVGDGGGACFGCVGLCVSMDVRGVLIFA